MANLLQQVQEEQDRLNKQRQEEKQVVQPVEETKTTPDGGSAAINIFPPAPGTVEQVTQDQSVAQETPELEIRTQSTINSEKKRKGTYWELLEAAGSEYNTIGSYRASVEARRQTNINRADISERDPSFSVLVNRPDLLKDNNNVPLSDRHQQTIMEANNEKDAIWKRQRILNSAKNAEKMGQYNFGEQLVSGIIMAGLDPVTWLGGGAATATGRLAYKSSRMTQALNYLENSGRVGRTVIGAAKGAGQGAAGAAAQFGTMYTFDPSVTEETIKRETTSSLIGGAAIPVGISAVGAARGAVRGSQRRIVDPDIDPSFIGPLPLEQQYPDLLGGPKGPIGRGLTRTGETAGTALDPIQAAAGQPVRNVAHSRHPDMARKLFEDPVGTGGREARSSSAELFKEVHLNKMKTKMDFNGHLGKYISDKNRVFPGFWSKWTNSQAKVDFSNETYGRMLGIENGVARAHPNPIIEEAAQNFYRVMQEANDLMVKNGVRGAENLQIAKQFVPRKFSNARINQTIESYMRTGMTRDAATDLATQDLAQVFRRGLDSDKSLSQIWLGEGVTPENMLMRQRGLTEFAERVSQKLADSYVKTGLTRRAGAGGRRNIRGIVKNTLDELHLDPDKKARLLEHFSEDSPYGTTPLSAMLKGTDASDSAVMRNFLDPDLATLLEQQLEITSGQSALARAGIKSKREWDAEVLKMKTDAADARKAYPDDFWEDVHRGFMGEAPKGGTSGVGPVLRRWKKAAAQSQLGLAGLSQVPDAANILGRGWHGYLHMSGTILRTMTSQFLKPIDIATAGKVSTKAARDKIRKGEILSQLETMTGDIIDPHRLGRGDVYLDEMTLRDRDVLSGFSAGLDKMGRGIDQVQAAGDRILGATSQMNTMNAQISMAGQKTVMHEIGRYMTNLNKGIVDTGLNRQLADLGFDPARLAELRPTWEANVEYGPFGGVRKMNHENWSARDSEILAEGMTRAMKIFQTQAFRGELPDRLRHPIVGALLHLRQSVLVAHNKSWKRGLNLGAGHMFTHMSAAMMLGMIGGYAREMLKHPTDPVGAANELFSNDEEIFTGSPGVRRAISNIPQLGGFTDVSSTILAPLIYESSDALADLGARYLGDFMDQDYANALHFGYNKYQYGPSRGGGLDAALQNVPIYSYARDAFKAGDELLKATGDLLEDPYPRAFIEEDSWKSFYEEVMGIAPAPFGNALGSLFLLEGMEEGFPAYLEQGQRVKQNIKDFLNKETPY